MLNKRKVKDKKSKIIKKLDYIKSKIIQCMRDMHKGISLRNIENIEMRMIC